MCGTAELLELPLLEGVYAAVDLEHELVEVHQPSCGEPVGLRDNSSSWVSPCPSPTGTIQLLLSAQIHITTRYWNHKTIGSPRPYPIRNQANAPNETLEL